MEQRWAKSKRFKVARLAKASDMDSNFNPTAVGATRACEGDVGKGEMGLLCGASSMRRRQARVHQLAASLGWSSMVDGTDGECWSWGFEGQTFKKGVNLCVKLTHYDLHHEDASKAKPWLVCCAGDAARVSQRGTIITTFAVTDVDRRLPSQAGTGKCMNQSRGLYTPMLAGHASETVVMPHFHGLVAAFREIEERGFVVVDGVEYEVPIKVVVVADMSFVWKYAERGCASGSGCFCWACKVHAGTRHLGYPGGCRKCRADGTACGADGTQVCRHWEPHTAEFGSWESARYAWLENNIEVPVSVRPAWNDKETLLEECQLR